MIYICNFYAHQREGVSNQIELLRQKTGGFLYAAGIFLNQQHLSYGDLLDRRVIVSSREFKKTLPGFVKSLPKNESIHYFSEEPELDKLKIFNSVSNNLYISMYRKPTEKYVKFLKRFKNLVRVFVELESHRGYLIDHGIKPEMVMVSNSPSMFERSFMPRNFRNRFIFASWNGGDIVSLQERGLISILDLVESNSSNTCNIILRDNEIDLYSKMIVERGLVNRVNLLTIQKPRDLYDAFMYADIVLFLMQKKITKDVPNSIIDGFMLGKPVIMTNVTDLANTVISSDIGWVISPGEIIDMNVVTRTYKVKSENAFAFSQERTVDNYVSTVISGYIL
jgi:glycosyltransferase involved in cell wall biosynthesis